LEPLLETALDVSASAQTSANLIESEATSDGSEVRTRVSRELKNDDSAGVFELSTNAGTVKLRLSQEACRREVYTPRRSSQFLAALQPWEPIRVVLNGKADWPSGRYYYLQDYYVILWVRLHVGGCCQRGPSTCRRT
jgi:hypothetical protein